jgi:hypothetical protein
MLLRLLVKQLFGLQMPLDGLILLSFYHWAHLFWQFNLFWTVTEHFRLIWTSLPRKLGKNGIATAKDICASIGVALWSQNSQKRPQNPA